MSAIFVSYQLVSGHFEASRANINYLALDDVSERLLDFDNCTKHGYHYNCDTSCITVKPEFGNAKKN